MRQRGASPGPTPTHEGFYIRLNPSGGDYYYLVDKDGKVVIVNSQAISPFVVNYQDGQWSTDNPEYSEDAIEEWGSYSIDDVEEVDDLVIFTYDGIRYTLDWQAGTLSPDVTGVYPG